MTRSTRHRLLSPAVASLCLAALRLKLQVENNTYQKCFSDKMVGAEAPEDANPGCLLSSTTEKVSHDA